MRVAETRAVNRALRKAYGIGICSVEQIGSFSEPAPASREATKLPLQPVNGNNGLPVLCALPVAITRSDGASRDRSTLPSATALRGRGDDLPALKLKAFFEQQFNLLTQRPALMFRDLSQSRLETRRHPNQQRDSGFRHGCQQK
jgi:hypothetical protein